MSLNYTFTVIQRTLFNNKSTLDVTTKGIKIDSHIKQLLDIWEKDHVLWLTFVLSNTLLTLVHTPKVSQFYK